MKYEVNLYNTKLTEISLRSHYPLNQAGLSLVLARSANGEKLAIFRVVMIDPPT